MDSYLRYVNKEERVFGKPPVGCVLDLAGRPFSGDIIKDNSPCGNNGAITGATWVWDGQLWVLSFDGTNDQVTVTNATNLIFTTDFTCLVWAKVPGTAAERGIFYKATGTNGYQIYQTAANNIAYAVGGITTWKGGNIATSISDNAWRFIGFSADLDGNLTPYNNGVAGTTNDISGIGAITTTANLFIGSEGASAYWNGSIALPRLMTGLLTTAQISSIYNQERHLFV